MIRKIFKAECEFPPWFSTESKELISKLLVPDPEQRITMSEIKQIPWFRKNFTPPVAFSIHETIPSPPEPPSKKKKKDKYDEENAGVSPRSFNAFQFITSMSSGFDLSNLFEIKRKPKRMFTSKFPAISVKERLEIAAREMNMRVKHMEDCKMKLQRRTEGRKGRLSVTAEVFEVAPEVSVVEFCKSSGDTLEYHLFCEDDVRPALKDIVWSWQGDDDEDDEVSTNDNVNTNDKAISNTSS
ncbi:CBL-interacting serine/threonine-protein kinase 16 [Cardamine amara subsp. amara]|uniref:non-specific serine/threonine protein kinase n=1 Tax=Cardamine amara subsp. amara TaxID=228776 RepID=A0ABD1C5N1_CARAN